MMVWKADIIRKMNKYNLFSLHPKSLDSKFRSISQIASEMYLFA